MATKSLQVIYYEDKEDGAEYKLAESSIGSKTTKVWIRPLGTKRAWQNVGTFKGSAREIKNQIINRSGAYNVIESQALEY